MNLLKNKNIKKCLVKEFLRSTIENTLILVCATFLDIAWILNFQIKLTLRSCIWCTNVEHGDMLSCGHKTTSEIYFFLSLVSLYGNIQKKKKKNNPTLYKSNNNISWQKRRWGGVCEKRVCEYG